MKKNFTSDFLKISLLWVLLVVPAFYINATNLWEGETIMPSSWGVWESINADSFASAQVGDTISLKVTDIDGTGTMKLDNGNWSTLAGTGSIKLTSNEIRVIITTLMLQDLQSTGLIVTGANYTLTSVELLAGNGGSGLEDAVWLGEKVFNSGWSDWQTFAASCFDNANVGDLLRINVKDLKLGAKAHLVTSQWTSLVDASDYITLSGGYFQFTITDALLSELQTNGMICAGVYYTLIGVRVIDPTTLPLALNSSVQVTNDWVWYSPDLPRITVDIENSNSSDVGANVSLSVVTDKYEPVTYLSSYKTVSAGAATTASFDIQVQPGFYRCVVNVNDEVVQEFNIGYEPEMIKSPVDAQSDFDSFWAQAKSDLSAVQPNYSLTLIPEKCTSARNVYLVEMNSVGDDTGNPVTIRGYYAEPVGNGTYPVIITYLGYDSDQTSVPYCPSGDSNPGYVELVLSCRGQSLNRYLDNNLYGDWFVYNLGDKDNYYYRGAYMDVVRGIDFIASRSKVQLQNIFAKGASQGGAFTIAAAALDTRIKAIAIGIPFMGDFPDYFEVGRWPAYPASVKQGEIGLSDNDMFTMLSYFDTKNLAPMITCPVIMASGLQDPVCPPHTHFAPYNNLINVSATDKEYQISALNEHATPSDWSSSYMAFFDKYMTQVVTKANIIEEDKIKYFVKERQLNIENVGSDNYVIVYDMHGTIIDKSNTIRTTYKTVLPNNGIYIVVVGDSIDTYAYKIVVN